MESETSDKRPKKAPSSRQQSKFSPSELELLLNVYQNQVYTIRFDNPNRAADSSIKLNSQEWSKVEESFNALNVGGRPRIVSQLKSNLTHQKSIVKRKLILIREFHQKMKNSEGVLSYESIPKITPWELQVYSILSKEELNDFEKGDSLNCVTTPTIVSATSLNSSYVPPSSSLPVSCATVGSQMSPVEGEVCTTCSSRKRLHPDRETSAPQSSDPRNQQEPPGEVADITLYNHNLKMQFDVLNLQRQYYAIKLAQVTGSLPKLFKNVSEPCTKN